MGQCNPIAYALVDELLSLLFGGAKSTGLELARLLEESEKRCAEH